MKKKNNILETEKNNDLRTSSGLAIQSKVVDIDQNYTIKFKDNIAGYIVGISGAYLVFPRQIPYKLKEVGVSVEHTKISANEIRVKLVSTLSDGDGESIWSKCHGNIVIIAWLGHSSNAIFFNNFNSINSGTSSAPVNTGSSVDSMVTALNSFKISLAKRDYVQWITTSTSGTIESGNRAISVNGIADAATEDEDVSGTINISALAQLAQASGYEFKMAELRAGNTDFGKKPKSVSTTFSENVEDALAIVSSFKLDFKKDTRSVSCILVGNAYLENGYIYYNQVSHSGKTVTIKGAPTIYRTRAGFNSAYCSEINNQDFLVIAKISSSDATSKDFPSKGLQSEIDQPVEKDEH